ncbi:HAMP domain-containing sensor histidine kinase [Stomatohabitans albus]|uniref:sensor histidine kinase n=1 Tax=Stomatohabitans albus TaxID=3110766 RepID=UPI00300C5015
MRRSVLIACVATAAISILLLATPLLINIRQTLERQEYGIMQYYAERVQVLLNDPKYLSNTLNIIQNDEIMRYQLFAGDHLVIAAGADHLANKTLPLDDVHTASQGKVGRFRANGVIGVTVPLRGSDQKLRVLRSDHLLRQQLATNIFMVLGLASLAILAAGVTGILVARRITKPLYSLEDTAIQLGEGNFTARAEPTGAPEIDTLAAALNTTAERLSTTLERQRQFNADASHQLKTPLTALRLNLEALEFTDADATLVEAALKEVDRLDATIQETLALADMPQGDQLIDLRELIEDRMPGWRTLAEAQGRTIEVLIQDHPMIRARPAAINQALQVLVDNALEHGKGGIVIEVDDMKSNLDASWTRLTVTDEGDGFKEGFTLGRGLRLARSLVQAEGGRLRLGDGPTACILVPSMSSDDALLARAAQAHHSPSKWRLMVPKSGE